MELLDGVQNALALKHVPDVTPRQDWFAGPEGRRADKVLPSSCLRTRFLHFICLQRCLHTHTHFI